MSSDPRHIAFEIMTAVRDDDAYVNLLLPTVLRERQLDARDAALTTELTHGTIRMQGFYDAIIDSLVKQPPEPAVRDALRLGAHQLLSMRVPDHAAVDTTVRLVRKRIGHKPVGFVNAVLRKVARRDVDQWRERIGANLDTTERLATLNSHPRWIVEELAKVVPDAELEDLLQAQNVRPKVTLVARPGLAETHELPGESGRLSPYAKTLHEGDPAKIPAVAAGRAGVQDEGSQMVAIRAAGFAIDGSDERWLDLCAGPGGKAALWGALANERGARLVANELQPHRADLVRAAVRALDNVEVVAFDGREGPWEPASFDRVLVDAPCTGLGALRRRPEARWRRRPDNLKELVVLQEQLLRRALELVRPGGVVAYATCSPVLAETSELVSKVVSPEILLVEEHRWWPHHDGTDAMYLALLTPQLLET